MADNASGIAVSFARIKERSQLLNGFVDKIRLRATRIAHIVGGRSHTFVRAAAISEIIGGFGRKETAIRIKMIIGIDKHLCIKITIIGFAVKFYVVLCSKSTVSTHINRDFFASGIHFQIGTLQRNAKLRQGGIINTD